ncbi:MAG: RHS repeat-associated core domain-containing protein, partial [Candidatus Brocadiia bacterium]
GEVWYHSNTLHLVYGLTDNAESVVETYRYDAGACSERSRRGAATVLDADGSDDSDGASDVDNPYLFTARRLDIASGLMQYRNRYYAVTLGRFISRDMLAYVDSLNLYWYAADRPALISDALGLWLDSGHKDLTNAVVHAAFQEMDTATLAELKGHNIKTDRWFPGFFFPSPHWISDEATPEGRSECMMRSGEFLKKRVSQAVADFRKCAGGEQYDFAAGRRGIIRFGTALHSLQDMFAHHCCTVDEHYEIDADDPDKHPLLYAAAVWATGQEARALRDRLESGGMSSKDINCCVETVYSR